MRNLVLFVGAMALSSTAHASGNRFNDQFNEGARKGCRASLTQDGAPEEYAGPYCSCVIAKMDKKYTIAQKLALTEEQFAGIGKECAVSTLQSLRK
jgi:hypothetical protein